MNTIPAVISELLFERDTLVVAGLGMFVKHYDGAKVNVITNHFERPSTTLQFDPQQRGEDGTLVHALAERLGATEDEARQEVNRFVVSCFNDLKNGNEVPLEGLGVLHIDDHGQLTFLPDDDANFNGDAFGLGDFDPAPVFDGKRSDTYATRPHASFDEDPDDEQSYHRHRRKTTLFSVLSLLLAIPVVIILLYFLEIIHFDFNIKPRPVPTPPSYYEPDSAVLAQIVCYYPIPATCKDTLVANTEPQITEDAVSMDVPETEKENLPATDPATIIEQTPEKPALTSDESYRINIIGGCFSQQENADKLVSSLHEEGFEKAYVMKRGKMFYVSYGGFATLEEANEELAKVKAASNSKAWILNK